jgi:hypothetical protein
MPKLNVKARGKWLARVRVLGLVGKVSSAELDTRARSSQVLGLGQEKC